MISEAVTRFVELQREDPMLRTIGLAVGLSLLVGSNLPVQAHYNMLLPQSSSGKRGEAVTLVYQWGHPFEHQLFDAPKPEHVAVVAPDGTARDLTGKVESLTLTAADGKNVKAFQVRFTPDQRGDYLVVLNAPPIWMPEDEEFLHDTVKVIVHVQAQNGWDTGAAQQLELMPLTRPYGLQPGMVFQAQALAEGKPLAGALVEIERYNPASPAKLPPDEHITRSAKTDPNGIVTTTLTEPGWWCLTAQRAGGMREHEGKKYPVKQRTTLWVMVDGAILFTPVKDTKGR
jgi:cobalt/nickel transport protein